MRKAKDDQAVPLPQAAGSAQPADDLIRPIAVQIACALVTHPRYAGAQTDRDLHYLASRAWAMARAIYTPR